MYRFKWPLCKKKCSFALSMMLQSQRWKRRDLWRYWLSKGCIKQWFDKPSNYGCLSKKCELGEQWSSDIAVSLTLAKLSDIQSENTRFETLWFTPLTSISSDAAYSSLLPLLFLRSLSSPIINIRSCHQDLKLPWFGLMEYHPCTGFHYSKLQTYLCHDYSSFSNISDINMDGSEYRQVSNFYPN